VRPWHAAGLAALAEGGYLTAYARLGKLFGTDGAPLHNHVSYLAIADLAAAAVRAERHLEARVLLERALARVGPSPGSRLDQLAARAAGLLADAGAGAHFGQALSDPAGDAWPFERAQLRLDYGEWLRRQRPNDTDFTNPANTRHPSEDVAAAAKYIAEQVAAVVAASGTSDDPEGYGQAVAGDLFPDVLSYVVGTPAVYGFARFNGRTLADNAPEAMLSLVTNSAVPSGLRPSVAQGQRASSFPHIVPA
jgi:hypothetical protein